MTVIPKTVFVTGGTGFLGHSLLPLLTASGYHVRALTRRPEQHQWLHGLDHVECVQGDVEQLNTLENALDGCDYVINAAAKFRFWGKRSQFEHTNIRGTANVLKAAHIANIKKFIHISSVVVIGNPQDPNAEIDETHPTNPIDDYQRSKLAGEQLALEYHAVHNLPTVVLRPGAFYGPHGRYAFNKMFFEDPLRGLPIGVNGGRHYTFPTYINDAAHAIVLALEHGRVGEVYNICSQYLQHRDADHIIADAAGISRFHLYFPSWLMVPFARVLDVVSRVTGKEPKYPMSLRSYILNDWRVSTKKAQRELGFTPTPFEVGVEETLAWYREIGVWNPKQRESTT